METEPIVRIADHGAVKVLQHRDFGGLGDQFRAVTERNGRQIEA